ncbi:prepilin peptidase, partial [Candidatus Wolfebacteria bacterium]|nr:prepilin peptidase [Candidatus Wolfebacteria bacterium]
MSNKASLSYTELMFYYSILFFLGLAFGSFLNVVSLRYKPEQKPRSKASLLRGGLFDLKIIGGRSRCPHCKKQLRWFELVPILSFLFIKGKCRSCGHKLSLQYPLVELLSALIFIFVPLRFATYNLQLTTYDSKMLLVVGCWLLVFLLFLLLAIIDFRHYIIPDGINILLAFLGIILIPITNYQLLITNSFLGHYSLLFGSLGNIWVNHIIAAVLAMAFFGLIIGISRGR